MSFPIVTKTFSALNDELTLPASSVESFYRIQVVGAGTLTLAFEDSFDNGTTYNNIRVRNEAAGTDGDMAVAGLYRNGNSVTHSRPRIRCSAFTSGTLTAFVQTVTRGQKGQMPPVDVTFTGAAQERTLPAAFGSEGVFSIQVIGAGTMTIQLQESLDGGATYVPIRVVNTQTGVAGVDITAAGLYSQALFTCAVRPKLAVTAFTSGTLQCIYRSITRAL